MRVVTTTYPFTAGQVFTTNVLDALASSSTFLSGYMSGGQLSSTYADFTFTGKFNVASAGVTAGQIRVYVCSQVNDTPSFPDAFTGTQGTVTITSAGILNSITRLAIAIDVPATNSLSYFFGPITLSSLFNGLKPTSWIYYVTHNTGAALLSGSNSNIWHRGIKYTAT